MTVSEGSSAPPTNGSALQQPVTTPAADEAIETYTEQFSDDMRRTAFRFARRDHASIIDLQHVKLSHRALAPESLPEWWVHPCFTGANVFISACVGLITNILTGGYSNWLSLVAIFTLLLLVAILMEFARERVVDRFAR